MYTRTPNENNDEILRTQHVFVYTYKKERLYVTQQCGPSPGTTINLSRSKTGHCRK